MPNQYNVITRENECVCFTCYKPTRLYVLEFQKNLCLDCIMTLSAVEATAEMLEQAAQIYSIN